MPYDLSVFKWSGYAYSALMKCPPEQEYDNNIFYIRDKKAYTEDNALIYKISVHSIPKKLSEDNIRRYFSQFGEVLEVTLTEDKNISRCATPKVGLVSFAKPESACCVLRMKKHRLGGSRISVIPAESWNQPNADKVYGSTENEDDVASTSKGASKATNGGTHMLSLNDDCIETIFGYLELKEQLRFAQVCERFQDIFQMHCKRKYKTFDLNNIFGMTLWETRDLFRFAGKNMASITGILAKKNRQKIVEFISIFCRKLKRIKLSNCKLRSECVKKLLHGCPQLQELTLRNCSLSDNSIQEMTNLKSLETLDLVENHKLTGEFISKLVQLKVLNLYGCCNIRNSRWMDICKSLRNLRALDIRECKHLSATLLEVLVEHCKELEILKMSCLEFPYEHVALLPRLKQLELLSSFAELHIEDAAQKRLLTELVAHKADQLVTLKITALNKLSAEHIALISELRQLKTLFVPYNTLVNDDALIKFCKLQQLEHLTIAGCRNVTNQGLLKLVKSCQRLHFLDIQLCELITNEFLLETIKFLKASEKRKQPFVLIAYDTAMDYYDATAIVQGIYKI